MSIRSKAGTRACASQYLNSKFLAALFSSFFTLCHFTRSSSSKEHPIITKSRVYLTAHLLSNEPAVAHSLSTPCEFVPSLALHLACTFYLHVPRVGPEKSHPDAFFECQALTILTRTNFITDSRICLLTCFPSSLPQFPPPKGFT